MTSAEDHLVSWQPIAALISFFWPMKRRVSEKTHFSLPLTTGFHTMHAYSQSQVTIPLECSRNNLSVLGLVGAARLHAEKRESRRFFAFCTSKTHLWRAVEASKMFIFYLITAWKLKSFAKCIFISYAFWNSKRLWRRIVILRLCLPSRSLNARPPRTFGRWYTNLLWNSYLMQWVLRN